MKRKISNIAILATISVFVIIFSGCAVPSGGCPFCGYPPGIVLDGEKTTCARCLSVYRVYLDGSVGVESGPRRQYQYTVPTNNTDATQRSLNQTGQFILEGFRQ